MWAFWLEHWAGSDTILHMNAGLIILAIGSLVSGKPLRNAWLLLPVAIAEAANETCDYLDGRGWTRADTLHDILWTMLWPVLLWFVSWVSFKRRSQEPRPKRRRRLRLRRRRGQDNGVPDEIMVDATPAG